MSSMKKRLTMHSIINTKQQKTMKKIIIFLILMTLTSLTDAFFLENIFRLKEGAEQQRLIVDELSKNKAFIKVIKKRGLNERPIFPPLYLCGSATAYKSLKKYKLIENGLSIRVTLSQLIDGIILGMFATFSSKKFPNQTPIIVSATIASAIAIIIHQNKIMGSVPYFDFYLKRYEDQYNNLNVETCVNVACVLISTALGLHIANKISQAQQQ